MNDGFEFPKNFLWGASIAAHQVEGDNNNQWTAWESENAKSLAANAEGKNKKFESWRRIRNDAINPENYISGKSTDHYNLYKNDFYLLKEMNMNSFRFSIEWSRIEPEDGVWDQSQIEFYRNYINELKARDVEPVVTLFHFTLPIWFAKKGGFEKRSNVKYFVRFAEKVMSELGSNIRIIITINEPEVYAVQSYLRKDWPPAVCNIFKFWSVLNNLIYAHQCVSELVHKMDKDCQVSIAKNSVYIHESGNSYFGKVIASTMRYLQDDYILKRVVRHSDFIGLNYYVSLDVAGLKVLGVGDKKSDLQWGMQPSDIQFVLERLYKKYHKPIIITENGLADATDMNRKWWISETITAIQKAMKNGVKLDGYLHWSLLDNFEWSYGKWPRFGLIEVDYKTSERKIRSSALWFGDVIKKIRNH